jgi:hypothetical protein
MELLLILLVLLLNILHFAAPCTRNEVYNEVSICFIVTFLTSLFWLIWLTFSYSGARDSVVG